MTTVPENRSRRALSALNFFLADVRDGLGPFLGVFLIGNGWTPDTIGYVMTIGGLAGMLATTPLGALVDATRAKRLIIAVAAALVIVGTVAILYATSFPVVAASQIGTGIVAAVIAPAVAGLTLGIVGQSGLARQLGRNEAWNHGGNVFAAVVAGLAGYHFGLVAVFALMAGMALLSIVSVTFIRPEDIDHDVARGLEPGARDHGEAASGFSVLLKSRPLILVGLAMMTFHLGNAAMLPLLSQSMVSQDLADPALFTATTVIVAQLTMIPLALLAARFAEKHGYWFIVLAALVALPIRGLIAGTWNSPLVVFPVQVLDGVGAGLLGVATPGIVAQILRGTGRINAGLGAVMTLQGVGAALSPAVGGFIAHSYGYGVAFIVLGSLAAIGIVIWLMMPRAAHEAPGAVPA